MLSRAPSGARRLATRLARAASSSKSDASPGGRVCIVGSGPAGFYTAKYLLRASANTHVDVLDALPTPYGAFAATGVRVVS